MHMNKKSRTRSEAIDSIELIREVNSLDNDFQCLKRSIDDAVKVYCNMSAGGETCVNPDIHASRMPNIPWRKSSEGWYSTLRGGFRISYDSLGPVQLTFLRLLSTSVTQKRLCFVARTSRTRSSLMHVRAPHGRGSFARTQTLVLDMLET